MDDLDLKLMSCLGKEVLKAKVVGQEKAITSEADGYIIARAKILGHCTPIAYPEGKKLSEEEAAQVLEYDLLWRFFTKEAEEWFQNDKFWDFFLRTGTLDGRPKGEFIAC